MSVQSLLHSCLGLATYWSMCKCCLTYILLIDYHLLIATVLMFSELTLRTACSRTHRRLQSPAPFEVWPWVGPSLGNTSMPTTSACRRSDRIHSTVGFVEIISDSSEILSIIFWSPPSCIETGMNFREYGFTITCIVSELYGKSRHSLQYLKIILGMTIPLPL